MNLFKSFKTFKIGYNFPTGFTIFFLGAILLYYFAYYVPFTNNAFVVADIRPVAADVGGYITDIYVKNGEYVKKDHPLFTVFKAPYEWAYKKATADLDEAQAQLIVLIKKVEKTENLLQSDQAVYQRRLLDYNHYAAALQDHSVALVTVKDLLKEKNAAWANLKSLQKELELEKQEIHVQEKKIKSLEAVKGNAQVNLDETTVYAKNNGIVQNMYLALGTPIELRKPIFSFVDSDHMYIQANFFETDLRFVKPGDKVTIYPRMYFWDKVYHGVVASQNWAVNRQFTDPRTQQQNISNNQYNWFLLPQRLPIQIHITDYDPLHYPLSIGTSVYVYIHTTS
jgi:multidrug efflux system membrane fusion protein